MCTFKLICVTNRHLCREDFGERMAKIVRCRPAAIILREKDLSADDYTVLAGQLLDVCQKYGVLCVLHNFAVVALRLGATALHLPLPVLRSLSVADRKKFSVLGASCHSVGEAKEAEQLGCTYITAGHIFDTDCKKNLPARGTDFLQAICSCVSVPVYAIGGMVPAHKAKVQNAGAAGVCVMSGMMTCRDVRAYMDSWRKA